ncbi:hypothetical protein VNO77_50179 [Canavalia gladiata]|uniref:Uncharacterized protein n=1 Tax=Canavalia gladiata TaxID=3824 RepID=A0AAN9JFP9_CANGL
MSESPSGTAKRCGNSACGTGTGKNQSRNLFQPLMPHIRHHGGQVALRRSKRERRPAVSYDYVVYLHEDGTLVDDPVTFSQA